MKAALWIAAAILALTWLLTLALAMTAPVNHDEHMYLGSASLLGEHRLYADFAFLQTPYSAWIYAGILHLAPGSWTLLPARLFKVLLAAGVILAGYRLARRLGMGVIAAAFFPLLLYHDEIWRTTAPLARNYDLAQLAILGAMLLVPLRAEDRAGSLRWALAGFLASLAVGFKLSYAPLSLVIMAWPMIMQLGRRAYPWVLTGAVVGLVPAGLAFTGVGLDVLWFNLVDYHLLNTRFNEAREVAGRLDARQWYRRTDHAALVAMALVTMATFRRRDWGPGWKLALALLPASLLMAFGPQPTQTAYGAPLVLALLLIPVAGLERRQGRTRLGLQVMVVLGGLVMIGHHVSSDARALAGLLTPSRWSPVQVHEQGRLLADCLGSDHDQPIIATQALVVAEGGLPLAPEWASYPFIWRLDRWLDSDQVRRVRAVTPLTLDEVWGDRSPAAILVRIGPRDSTLVEWARSQGQKRVPLDEAVEVWVP